MAIIYDQTNNKITVTGYTEGTPCNFNNLYTTDIGATNGRDLLDGAIDADPDTFSLDSQPAPADSLAIPLKITCASRAGATCDIAGTDAWGNALTENGIDISSGSATTTKRFATVDASGITVNGVTNGDDFDVKQDRWGVVWKIGDNQFLLGKDTTLPAVQSSIFLQIGDGSIETHFADFDKQITFAVVGTHYYPTMFKVKNNAHLTLGKLVDSNLKTTKNGCAIGVLNTYHLAYVIKGETTDVVYLYSCKISAPESYKARNRIDSTHNIRIWNTIFDDRVELVNVYGDIFNVIIQDAQEGILEPYGTYDSVTITDTTYALVVFQAVNPVFKNLKFRNNTYILQAYFTATNIYIIDADTDNWAFAYTSSPNAVIYRQNTFNLKVTDKDGNNINDATVTLWDKDDNQIFSVTTSSGVITEQIVSYGYYNEPNGNNIQLYSPHTIQISKAGYETYKKKFTLDKKIDWTIRLKHSNVCVDQEAMLA